MSKAETVIYQSVQHDLGETIRCLRSDCQPMETARSLLSYDGEGQRLVGIRYDGQRSVYYQESSRDAIAVFFGIDGLDKRGGRPIANLGQRLTVREWAEK